MMAPLPALPVTEPIPAPVPAPIKPPDSARSPGVGPQAESAMAVAKTHPKAPVRSAACVNMFHSRLPGFRESQRWTKVQCSKQDLGKSDRNPVERLLVFEILQPVEEPHHRIPRKALG